MHSLQNKNTYWSAECIPHLNVIFHNEKRDDESNTAVYFNATEKKRWYIIGETMQYPEH